jgi:hypothetical protein
MGAEPLLFLKTAFLYRICTNFGAVISSSFSDLGGGRLAGEQAASA